MKPEKIYAIIKARKRAFFKKKQMNKKSKEEVGESVMVNIIIPIYNARETLPKTLDSLVAQTKPLFMVTLVQDADGIDYSDIIDEYRRRGLHIKLEVLPENVGPGLARQRGIDISEQFEYLMFLDSDDLLQPRAIDVLTREVKKNNLDILSSSFVVERPGVDTYVKGDGSASTWVLGKIYRRAFLVDNGIRFADNIRLNEDSYFNLVALNCTDKKSYIDEPLGIRRYYEKSLTQIGKENNEFFYKSNHLYIYGQIRGVLDISRIYGSVHPGTYGQTILNIYESIMKQEAYGMSDEFYREDLKELVNSEDFKTFFSIGQNWLWIAEHVKACSKEGNDIIFFHKTFREWFEEVTNGEFTTVEK